MTWSLSAGGHTNAPQGSSDWREVEQELHDRLAEVLSDPRYGTTSSHFGGNYISGAPHTTAPRSEAALQTGSAQLDEAGTDEADSDEDEDEDEE